MSSAESAAICSAKTDSTSRQSPPRRSDRSDPAWACKLRSLRGWGGASSPRRCNDTTQRKEAIKPRTARTVSWWPALSEMGSWPKRPRLDSPQAPRRASFQSTGEPSCRCPIPESLLAGVHGIVVAGNARKLRQEQFAVDLVLTRDPLAHRRCCMPSASAACCMSSANAAPAAPRRPAAVQAASVWRHWFCRFADLSICNCLEWTVSSAVFLCVRGSVAVWGCLPWNHPRQQSRQSLCRFTADAGLIGSTAVPQTLPSRLSGHIRRITGVS